MPTTKYRATFVIPRELSDQIDEFMHDERHKSRSAATVALLKHALNTAPRKKKQKPSRREAVNA
jgi:metal-responsive CopG/Arc/MetJ family transcriptional regulator